MRTIIWSLAKTAAGSAEGPVTAEDAAQATNTAIEGVQSITSLFHLPTWVGRMIFIVLVVVIMLWLVKLVNKVKKDLRAIKAIQA